MSFEKRIVLAGGTGFIGQELGLALVRRGYHVTVATRSPETHIGCGAFPCDMVQLTQNLTDDLVKAVDGAHAVINLTGAPVDKGDWDFVGPNSVFASRVDPAKILVQATKKALRKPRVFIQASGVGYYGPREDACDEKASAGETYLAKVAQAIEGEAKLVEEYGVRYAAVRLGVVLGPGNALDEINKFYAAGLGGRIKGSERIPMPWLHLDDAVGIFLHILDHETCQGAVNGVAPTDSQGRGATLADLDAAMRSLRGLQLAPTVPEWVARPFMRKRIALLTENPHVIPAALAATGYHFLHTDLTRTMLQLLKHEGHCPYRLLRKQYVPAKAEDVWSFFSSPRNLEAITPPWLQFQIKNLSDEKMAEGTRITYRLRLKGVPLTWKSVISKSVPGREFVDEQTSGPYAVWHHHHLFEPLGDGVLITDDVRYALPVGKLGNLIAGGYVSNDVKNIFAYRAEAVAKIFLGSMTSRTGQ